MKKIYIFLSLIILISLVSCLRLDNNLFNSDDTIDKYYLEDYTGEVDFKLPSEYSVSKDEITLFTLESNNDGDIAKIYALYLGNIEKIATDTVIMYCHGNKDHIDFNWQRQKLLYFTGQKKNYGVLTVDYRGYGLSEGNSTESGLIADISVALQWLKDNGLTDDRLIIYGFSLGSIPAIEHSANPTILEPSKLILEAPIGSIKTMVQDASGGLSMPTSFFVDLNSNNIEKIKDVAQPLLLFEGGEDIFLTYDKHGKPLFDNYKGIYKKLILVDKAVHGTIPLEYGLENYMLKMEEFIKK